PANLQPVVLDPCTRDRWLRFFNGLRPGLVRGVLTVLYVRLIASDISRVILSCHRSQPVEREQSNGSGSNGICAEDGRGPEPRTATLRRTDRVLLEGERI